MEGAWAVVHDLFEIVGGLAAAIAVGFSVWITSRERADRQAAERDRDEARAAQRRAELEESRRAAAAQAQRVVILVKRSINMIDGRSSVVWSAEVHNYSDMPVTEVAIQVDGAAVRNGTFQVLVPGGSQGKRLPSAEGPRDTRQVAALFTDAAGRRWRRDASGDLAPLLEPGPTT